MNETNWKVTQNTMQAKRVLRSPKSGEGLIPRAVINIAELQNSLETENKEKKNKLDLTDILSLIRFNSG